MKKKKRIKLSKNKKIILLLIIILIVFILTINSTKNNIEDNNIETDKFIDLRKNMVDEQLKTRDITDQKVLDVMGKVQRHEFVPLSLINNAYDDNPLPIGYGQTISQPYIVALMTQSLDVNENDKVLEIGTGSGYQAAVLSEMVEEVYTIEIIKELSESANDRLKNLDNNNVKVKNADGYFEWLCRNFWVK